MNVSIRNGITASLELLLLYVVTMTFLNSWKATVEQFRAVWFLMVPLSVGFGIQVGLYTQLKQKLQTQVRTSLAAGGTSASLGMLACCAHHATDVLPILGLSGVSIFLASYQKPILAISLLINAVGIALMIKHLRAVIV